MSRGTASGRAAWLAGAAAIMPVVALGVPLVPATALPASQFLPPSDPMFLTRVLRRPLPGGAEVTTSRKYEIRFSREGDGFRVDGMLVSADINVPARYQALAAIERARPDDGMFPLRLDANGWLVPGADNRPSEATQKAGALALDRIGMFGLSPDQARQAKAFVGQLAASPARTAWPEDLFRPEPGQHRQTRTIALPNGASGHVSIDIEASTAGPAGLLSSLNRTVTTDIDGDARVAYETWTLVQSH